MCKYSKKRLLLIKNRHESGWSFKALQIKDSLKVKAACIINFKVSE